MSGDTGGGTGALILGTQERGQELCVWGTRRRDRSSAPAFQEAAALIPTQE